VEVSSWALPHGHGLRDMLICLLHKQITWKKYRDDRRQHSDNISMGLSIIYTFPFFIPLFVSLLLKWHPIVSLVLNCFCEQSRLPHQLALLIHTLRGIGNERKKSVVNSTPHHRTLLPIFSKKEIIFVQCTDQLTRSMWLWFCLTERISTFLSEREKEKKVNFPDRSET
jgi:hypothetical protein